jgi:4-hydroxyphenylpyruvate dioxygenase
MRRSIATVSLAGPLEGKLRAAAAAGFDAVELFDDDLVCCPRSPEDVAALAAGLGLAIDLYQPLRDFEAVPPEAHRRNLGRARRKLEVARRLGAPAVLVCSSVSEEAIDDDALAAVQLRALADLAAEHGIRVAYEALAWGRHVADYRHAWRIVEAADHPNLGLCVDSFHVLTRGVDPAGLERIPGDRVFFVQLADAPRLPMHVLHWSRHHRCFPGQGDLDVAGLLGHVLAAGYRGPLSLEVFNDVFRRSDPLRTARDGMRSLLALEESLRPAALPPPPALRGFAFAEVAAGTGGDVERALAGLGFAPAARHRSKPVRLWRQGEATVLVNAAAGTPGLAALAVESGDPAASAARARALLAAERPRGVGPGEAVMAEIAAPDGTSVFFCRTDAGDAASWIGDFAPEPASGRPPECGLRRIDHVGLAHPFGTIDEAALFYRSVLGLRAIELPELAAIDGLRRAETLTGGGVRVALDTPLVAGGPLAGAQLQHVAFATQDIVASARAIRALGAPVLAIPANYYDDLAARFELDTGTIDTLAALDVLYDRDDRGGELFHLYTPVVGRGLFFEVVQRVGGYAGLGARNAPVRVAAQWES